MTPIHSSLTEDVFVFPQIRSPEFSEELRKQYKNSSRHEPIWLIRSRFFTSMDPIEKGDLLRYTDILKKLIRHVLKNGGTTAADLAGSASALHFDAAYKLNMDYIFPPQGGRYFSKPLANSPVEYLEILEILHAAFQATPNAGPCSAANFTQFLNRLKAAEASLNHYGIVIIAKGPQFGSTPTNPAEPVSPGSRTFIEPDSNPPSCEYEEPAETKNAEVQGLPEPKTPPVPGVQKSKSPIACGTIRALLGMRFKDGNSCAVIRNALGVSTSTVAKYEKKFAPFVNANPPPWEWSDEQTRQVALGHK